MAIPPVSNQSRPLTGILKPDSALIDAIAHRLKPSDVQAMRLFGFENPAAALRLAYESGEVLFVGTVRDEPVCVVSVIPKKQATHAPEGGRGGIIEGSIWMVTTPEFSAAPVAALRKSLKRLDEILKTYHALDTFIDRSNSANIRYALFLGFEDSGARYDTIIDGVTLGYFRKERKPSPMRGLHSKEGE